MPKSDAPTPVSVENAKQTALAAGRVVSIYAAFASLWILVSDTILTWLFSDPAVIHRISIAKGWLFVAVTTLLLYGLIRRMQLQAQKISDRELQAQMDRASIRQLLDNVVESSTDAIFAKDLEGRYLLFNKETSRVLGKTPEQALGLDDTVLLPHHAAAIRANDQRVISENRTITYEEIVATANGERTFLATKGPLREVDGRVIGLFGIARDITDRKEFENQLAVSELRLRALIQAIPNLVWLKDISGVYLSCNSRFEKFFGAQESDIIGKTDYDFVDKELADFFRENDQIAMDKGDSSRNEEWVTFASDGHRELLETTKTPVRNAQGQVIGVLGIGHDITERKRQHDIAEHNRIRLQTILKTAGDGIHILDGDGVLVEANESFLTMLGYDRSAIGVLRVENWETDLPWAEIKLQNDALIAAHGKLVFETHHRRSDGSILDVEINASGLELDGIGYVYAASRDISQRKRLQAALIEGEERYRTIIEWSPEPIGVHRDGRFLYVNPAAVKMFGAQSNQDLIGLSALDLVHPDSREVALERQTRLTQEGQSNPLAELQYVKIDGSVIDVEVQSRMIVYGGETAILVAMRDITERKANAQEIEHLAFYDSLTDLPNRRLMLDRLKQALNNNERHGHQGALMLIDLDNFKQLNDTLGHAVGDQLLVSVATRLRGCTRAGDTVARMGGDEFVVILEGLDQDETAAIQAEQVAAKILKNLAEPYTLGTTDHTCETARRSHLSTSSIGMTLFKDQSASPDELMKRADTAMYQAKASGRNTLRFFDLQMQHIVSQRAGMELDLRDALDKQQFVLYYQAQVNSTGHITGAEALLRWRHPERGLVPPNDFIPLAEDTGLIVPLGQWVLETACLQLAAWSHRADMADLTMAVNVSAKQFGLPNIVDLVLEAVNRAGVPRNKLKLELTESLLLENTDAVVEKMVALKAQGIGFSLDDFGTGYSSLAYLKRLPLDQLKIDRSFVCEVLTDPNDAAIARTIVALGTSLGLAVIAEGVETEAQRDFLADNNCWAYQGYLFSRPLPLDEFEKLVRQCGT